MQFTQTKGGGGRHRSVRLSVHSIPWRFCTRISLICPINSSRSNQSFHSCPAIGSDGKVLIYRHKNTFGKQQRWQHCPLFSSLLCGAPDGSHASSSGKGLINQHPTGKMVLARALLSFTIPSWRRRHDIRAEDAENDRDEQISWNGEKAIGTPG